MVQHVRYTPSLQDTVCLVHRDSVIRNHRGRTARTAALWVAQRRAGQEILVSTNLYEANRAAPAVTRVLEARASNVRLLASASRTTTRAASCFLHQLWSRRQAANRGQLVFRLALRRC